MHDLVILLFNIVLDKFVDEMKQVKVRGRFRCKFVHILCPGFCSDGHDIRKRKLKTIICLSMIQRKGKMNIHLKWKCHHQKKMNHF